MAVAELAARRMASVVAAVQIEITTTTTPMAIAVVVPVPFTVLVGRRRQS
jgi:hypothetical protein